MTNGSGLARFDVRYELRWLSIRPDGTSAGPPASTPIDRGAAAISSAITRPFQTTPGVSSAHSRRPHDARPLQQQLPDRTSPDSILIMLEMVTTLPHHSHMNAQHRAPFWRSGSATPLTLGRRTLVVETTNFTDQTRYRVLNGSEVTERFSAVSDKTSNIGPPWKISSTWASPGLRIAL